MNKKQQVIEVLDLIQKYSKESNRPKFVDELDVKSFTVELLSKFEIK